MMEFDASPEFARELDRQDELAPFRSRFVVAEPALIYLDGNSLGRLPQETAGRLRVVVEQEWGERLIRGWSEGWIELPQRSGAAIAGLLGARPDEVICADSTSVNLFKLTLAALLARPGRPKVVTDDLNFPSDLYILQGVVRLAGGGRRLEIVKSADGIHGPVEGLAEAMDDETALVALSHTVFKSGYTYDLDEVTGLAQRAGAMALWDLSHSAGVVPVELNGAGAELAVGCTYKYLNGGPGAPAFLYVRRDLQAQLGNPISGWMGQREPFEFGLTYEPAAGLRRFLSGTPAVLGLSAVEGGVELVREAGVARARAKSVQQTEYLIRLWESELAALGFSLNSPGEAGRRGAHVSLGHPAGLGIDRALIAEMNVLSDFRYPDNIRLGLSPLYNTFGEIQAAVSRLRVVVEERRFEKYLGEPAQRDGC